MKSRIQYSVCLNVVTIWKPGETKPQGQPRQRLSDRIGKNIKFLKVMNEERLALDKDAW